MTLSFAQVSRILLAGVLLLAVGCNFSDGPQRAAIEGTVTFDGAPVETGSIQFIPVEGVVGKPVAAPITNGKYSLSRSEGPAVGRNQVIIDATRKTGKQVKNIMGEMEEELEHFIPARYNTETELQVDIESGDNEKSFELTAE